MKSYDQIGSKVYILKDLIVFYISGSANVRGNHTFSSFREKSQVPLWHKVI